MDGHTKHIVVSAALEPSSVEVLAGSGSKGFADGSGAAAQLYHPEGVAVDGEGSIIIADSSNHRVRKITPDGTVSTPAGAGRQGFADGAGAAAHFNYPYGVAVDGEGSIIIADYCDHRVRKITPDGTVSTLAGSGRQGLADGAGAAAQFKHPIGVAVDGEGNFIITDQGNHRVRKITPDGTMSTLAGSERIGLADGAGAAAAQFCSPIGFAVDGEGSIIIADCGNQRVRKITPDGTVSTLAGSKIQGFPDGAGAAAQFHKKSMSINGKMHSASFPAQRSCVLAGSCWRSGRQNLMQSDALWRYVACSRLI
jgi:sugar lactone lactonase YvrE